MKKKSFPVMWFVLQGIGIGVPTALICIVLSGGFNETISDVIVWTVASALIGLLSGWVFYQNSDWSLLRAIAVHCVGCLALVVGAGWFCGYDDSIFVLMRAMLPGFIIVYVLIYLFIYWMMKQEAKRVNQMLEQE